MATINVYTYYTHKLAHDKMPRPQAVRPALRLPRMGMPAALVLLVLWLRFLPPAHPVAAFTGCLLAFGLLCLIRHLGIRTRKVWRALMGHSLGADDLAALRGH
ncbi:MAG: hypothetical protein J0I12_17080 [Candidatus Eremiobacteraeota bacterium]|nr:hypothetical protein [Candidatus Eremiobacteraeota bacterium]